MMHFVGLDVSVKATSVCIVDNTGNVILEQKVPTEPADIIALLRTLGVKAWGMRVAQRRGIRRAIVAVAGRLAVVLHRMWVDSSEFRWSKHSAAVPAVARTGDG